MDCARTSCFSQFARAAAAGNAALLMIAQGQCLVDDEGKDITAEREADIRKRAALAERMMVAHA